jgi:hypothetical protein
MNVLREHTLIIVSQQPKAYEDRVKMSYRMVPPGGNGVNTAIIRLFKKEHTQSSPGRPNGAATTMPPAR